MVKSRRQYRRRGGASREGFQPVPRAFKTVMSYYDRQNLVEAAAGVGAYYTYALTNLFDPNFTAVGTQPVSFDEWATMYRRFRVLANQVEVTFVCNTNAPVEVGYFLSTAPTLPASIFSWPVQSRGNSATLSYNTGGNAVRTFRFKVLPWDILGLTRQQYMDDMDFSHSNSAGPSRTCYMHLFTSAYLAAVANVVHTVKMKYSVELSELAALNIS
jgi:hypothetical protein